MKTTLVLEDSLVEQVRIRARERGVSMSSVVEEAIVRLLNEPPAVERPRLKLPSWPLGPYLVDITNRDALYDAMDDEETWALYRGER